VEKTIGTVSGQQNDGKNVPYILEQLAPQLVNLVEKGTGEADDKQRGFKDEGRPEKGLDSLAGRSHTLKATGSVIQKSHFAENHHKGGV